MTMNRLLSILCCVTWPLFGHAASENSILSEAQARLAAENYPAVDALLASLLAMQAPPLEALFLSGVAAAQRGDFTVAADRFRAMLTRDPTLIRPRLELALVLQKAGDRESAKYHYEQVLSAPLPDAVKWNIYRQLGDIRARSPSIKLTLELASDTNPQQTTRSRVVMIGGLPYTLSDTNQGKLKWGAAASAEVHYPLPGDPSWFVQAYGLVYEYPGRDLDNLYGQASLGKRFERGRDEITVSAGAHVSAYRDHRQYNGWISRATGQWVVSPSFTWLGDAMAKTYRYQATPFLDGTLGSLGVTAVYIPNPASRYEWGVGLAHYAAAEMAYGYWQSSVNLRVSQEWAGGWISGVRVQALKSDYQAADPFFGVVRKDNEGRVEVDLLNRKLRWLGFSPQLMVGYVKRDSNLELYRYDRIYSRIGMSTAY